MVLMGMGKDDPMKFFLSLQQIAHIRNNYVNSQEVCPREHQATIDGDDRIAILHEHHVISKLPQPA